MDSRQSILFVLNALPSKKVIGKKRIQKLVHLLQVGGASVDATYKIHHYGPYSFDVAEALEDLALSGEVIEKTEAGGVYEFVRSTFSLPEHSTVQENSLDEDQRELLAKLDRFSTVELEVASTIAFFEGKGLAHEDALTETKSMKKSKSIPPVLRKAKRIRDLVRQE